MKIGDIVVTKYDAIVWNKRATDDRYAGRIANICNSSHNTICIVTDIYVDPVEDRGNIDGLWLYVVSSQFVGCISFDALKLL